MKSETRSEIPAPICVEIEALNEAGRGVVEYEGKPMLIDNALPGERVSLIEIMRRRRYVIGKDARILRPSRQRVTPPCPHFGVCGGCQLQHLQYAAQCRHKQDQLAAILKAQAGLTPRHWREPLLGQPYGYRRKARLAVRDLPKRGVVIGFRARGHSYIRDLDDCAVLESRLAALLASLHGLVGGLDCSDRLPQIEIAAGDSALALVFRHLVPLSQPDQEALIRFAEEHDVQVYTQAAGPRSAQRLWPAQAPGLAYALPTFNVRIEFGPTDFIQVNAAVNEQLVSQVIAALEIHHNDHVLELFAGLGNFTLPLGRRASVVDAVEASPGLIERGQHNAAINGLNNIQWHELDLYRQADALVPFYRGATKLLLDPPREGAIESLKHLPAGAPNRIVYVSCNPRTLARDCAYLVNRKGFELVEAGLVEMFPQTKHIEALAILKRS